MPAASIMRVVRSKEVAQIDDRFLVMADVAEKALRQVIAFVTDLLDDRMPPEKAQELAELLAGGHFTHDFPITVERANELGLEVKAELPAEIYDLMELFPQATRGRPSVTYLPLPAPPGRVPPG
jgi:hypothetical protein